MTCVTCGIELLPADSGYDRERLRREREGEDGYDWHCPACRARVRAAERRFTLSDRVPAGTCAVCGERRELHEVARGPRTWHYCAECKAEYERLLAAPLTEALWRVVHYTNDAGFGVGEA